ncbi:MAG TPA: SH3 domain-containing protein [Burkholderiales bacterium]|nr:SH3 domain-containing protein [Burkholderiales bacterium]
MRAPRSGWCVFVAAAALFWAAPAFALDFRSVSENAAILYDGPSARSPKLYVVNRGYPLEIILAVEGWVKVRDAHGSFGWIEAKNLTEKRTAMVKVPMADVRAKPDDSAPVAFQAQQNVLLDIVSVSGGWVQVRHRDGGSGYVRAQQLWGA